MPRKKWTAEAAIRRNLVDAVYSGRDRSRRRDLYRAYDAGLLRAGVRFGSMLRDIADVVGCHPGASGMIADAIAEADRLAGDS